MNGVRGSEAGIKGKSLVSFVHSDPEFRIFSNPFFDELIFPLRLIISIQSSELPIL